MSDVYELNTSHIDALVTKDKQIAALRTKLAEARELLNDVSDALAAFYDPSEDNLDNPMMRSTGNTLRLSLKWLAANKELSE